MSYIFWVIMVVVFMPIIWKFLGKLTKFLVENWMLVAFVVLIVVLVSPKLGDKDPQTDTGRESTYSAETESAESVYEVKRADGAICRNLREDAAAVVVFVDDLESSWTQRDIDSFMANLVEPGLDFIVQNAAAYGYNIRFDCAYYKDVFCNDTVTVDPNYGCYVDFKSLLASSVGQESITGVLEDNRQYFGTDQIAYLFVLNKSGRSFSQAFAGNGDTIEYAVLFSSINNRPETPSTIAHETMHLFGAEDLYEDHGNRANRAAMAASLYPRELFLTDQKNLWDNQISDFTAHAVGWIPELPEIYKTPEWWS